MADILQEVDENEIPSLLEEFKDFNKYFFLRQYLSIMLELKEAKVEAPKQTLFRYGCVKQGVYLLQSDFPKVPFTTHFVFTASEDLADLEKVLMETNHIPWVRGAFYFEVMLERFQHVFKKVSNQKSVELSWKHNVLVWLPPEDPLDLCEVPEDMYLSHLNKSHIAEINNNWPHSFPGSVLYLEQQVTNHFGWGLFRKKDDKLACSALTFHSGGIFVLYTDPEFRGKGCAELIIRQMCLSLREKERIPFGTILQENKPSQKLFQKCGFKPFTNIYFLQAL